MRVTAGETWIKEQNPWETCHGPSIRQMTVSFEVPWSTHMGVVVGICSHTVICVI